MLALEVKIDGVVFAIASVSDWYSLGLRITALRGDPEAPAVSARTDHVELSVSGSAQENSHEVFEHLRWGNADLGLGSEVQIRVIDTKEHTSPLRRYRSDREVQEEPFTQEEIREMRRKTYLELKQEFEGSAEDTL